MKQTGQFWGVLTWAAVLLSWTASGASAQEPLATITGGVRAGNTQFFDWEVTNHYLAPIVFIHFPHYHGDNFEAPKGWKQEWDNRAMLGSKDAPGWCRALAESPATGIQTNRKAKFSMRVNRAGAIPRPGTVIVRFADDSEFVLDDVEVPSEISFMERNIMVFALAGIFVVALLLHANSRRKAALKQGAASIDEPSDPSEQAAS